MPPDLTSWMLSEYLYILDDMCNNRNAMLSKTVDNEVKIQLKKQLDNEYSRLKNIQITAGDFLHNVQSLVHFIMEWQKCFANHRDNTPIKTRHSIEFLIKCVSKFSHRLFIQGK